MNRILITTGLFPPEIGGPATYSRFLKDMLPSHDYAVDVLPFREVRKYWPVVRHVVFFFKVLLRGRDADILYAQDTFSVGFPSAVANLFLRKKFIVRIPGDHVWEQGTRRFGITEPLEQFPLYSKDWHPLLLLMRFFQQFTVKSAKTVVVPSQYMQKVIRRWELPGKNVRLIYNGVEEFPDTGNKPVLRGLLRFQGKLIISVGRLVPWKGFAELISLLPDLKKEVPDLKLLIVGSGLLLKELEDQAASLGLSDDVIFTGELERDVLARYIRVSDVFVLNSRYEGLSHQLLETMAIGVPVVATQVGGNPEVIEEGKSGFLFPLGDKKKLAMRIVNLLRDPTLRGRVVLAGKRRVKQFSNDRMIEETVRLLKTL